MGSHTLSLDDPRVREFWRERHLCSASIVKPDSSIHVVPMGFVLAEDSPTAWAITSGDSYKTRLLAAPAAIAVCQIDGGRWSTLQGIASVQADEASVANAVRLYASRYREPRPNPARVAVRVDINRVIGRVP